MRSPYALRRPVANEYLVRKRDRRLVRELLAVTAAVLVAGTGLLAYTWIHLEITEVGYRVERLEETLHGLRQLERQLRLEATYLEHPARLEERAYDELGMRPPRLDETLFLHEISTP
ncbi:MAG: hypothetical protein AAGC60_07590 [Acidobacteriota bacterium]